MCFHLFKFSQSMISPVSYTHLDVYKRQWLGDDGFYYSTYDQPKEGSQLMGITDTQKVYFHKLGTKQSDDQLIIGGEDFKRRYMGISVSDDDRFLILSASTATNGNELYLKDLKTNSDWIPVQKGYDFNTDVMDTKGCLLYTSRCV